jgi:AcrR family transcriptional regulator
MPSKGDLTKQRILEVARALFHTKGYDATSTAEIAKGACISEAAMYKYFKSKKDLLIASVQPTYFVNEQTDYTNLSNVEVVEHWTALFLEKVENNIQQYIILFGESIKYPELSEAYLELFHKDTDADLEVRKRIKNGDFPDLDLTLLQVGMIGALIAMIQHLIIYKQQGERTIVPDKVKQVISSIISGKFFA